MSKYLLGLDNGCTMIKATVFDCFGNEIGTYGDRAEAISPYPNWYERNTESLWQANAASIRGAIQKAGIDPADIAGISITGHGNGAYLIDESGDSVRNAILGTDGRALSYVEKLKAEGYDTKFHPRTMQSLWPAISLVIMLWLKDNEPQNYETARWLMSATDYIRFRLTGAVHSEITNLSSTGLMNNAESRIDHAMLAELGVPEMAEKIPPILPSFSLAGIVTAQAAQITGLIAGTPVYGGCFDVDAAALATGSIDPSSMTIITGSWANNQYIGSQPLVAEEFFSTTAFSNPGYWLMLEGSPTSASNLEWFVSEFLQMEKEAAGLSGASVYDICNRAVAETDVNESDIVFLPYLFGSNTNPYAKACFAGLQGWHERRHVIRAIYEGICFSHRYHIEKLFRYLPNPKVARMSGGGAKSSEWSQMFADILQMTIEIPEASELGNLGAAICAGIGAGIFQSINDAIARMVKISKVVRPDASRKEAYDKKYMKYQKLIASLDEYWEK